MPIYTYACGCGAKWDEVRSVKEDSSLANEACPACMADAAEGIDTGWQDTRGKKVPSTPGPPLGGPTPRFHR